MTTPRPEPLADDLALGPDGSTLTRQHETHILSVLVWQDPDGDLLRKVDAIVQPDDFLRPEHGRIYRWHRKYVAVYGVPDGAALAHAMAREAAKIRPDRPVEAARLDELSIEVAHLAGGHPDTFTARVLHYATQIRLAAVVRRLDVLGRERLQELRLVDRTPEEIERVVQAGRDAEDELLARLRA